MTAPRRALRVLIEWPGLPGYAVACMAALRARHAVETLVLYSDPDDHARFSPERLQQVGPVAEVTGASRAVVVVSHDERVVRLADRVIDVADGHVTERTTLTKGAA